MANQTKREFCRFLVLKALENDLEARLLSPSGVVDAFWHAALLHPVRTTHHLALHVDPIFQ